MHQTQALYRNLIVIGCGPHFRKRYYSVLEKENISIALLIDLQANEQVILEFFKDKPLKPKKTLFLDESYRNFVPLEDLEQLLAKIVARNSVDAVLLCTEPKVRKPYALWTLRHQLPLFMDKPPNAFHGVDKMDTLLKDFDEILREAEKAKVNVVVSCERRAHMGYRWVTHYLNGLIKEEGAPITSVDIHFANGHWLTPHEYIQQEHHPFKYGYGLLLHSGYHYIDLLSSLLLLNQKNKTDEMDYYLKVICTDPLEQLSSLGKAELTCTQKRAPISLKNETAIQFGETDFLLIGQARSRGQLISNFSIKLINTSLSKRVSDTPSTEADWRLRQEHLIVHLGHLASLNVTSNPLKKLSPENNPLEDFTILIMHSPLLKNRKPLLRLTREDISNFFPSATKIDSLNQYARQWQLKEFLHGRNGNSPLKSHRETVRLLDLIYAQIYKEYKLHYFVMSQGLVSG